MDRREFFRVAGAAAAVPAIGVALTACGDDKKQSTAVGAKDSTTTKPKGPLRKVKLGFIALTDCASLVMAKELGYFEQRGLDVTLEKQASWPATRDNLLIGAIDGAHCLTSMPYSVATKIGGDGSQALKIAMILNQNGQAITLNKDFASVGYGDLAKAKAALESKSPTLAMTFPGGTHDTWLRYWLKATKAKNLADIKIIPIPPPQMVANMTAGAMDGYCVGEPWNAIAVTQGIGFTHLTSQDLWQHHPEKALVVNEGFATKQPDVLKDLMGAVIEAGKWLDTAKNRLKAAETIGGAQYVNAPAADIQGRMEGKYDLGQGLGTKTYVEDTMRFYRDGQVNAPMKAHGIWFMSQYQRLGLLKEAPPYQQIVDSIVLSDVYAEVAKAEGVDVPDDMKPFEIALDKVTFDPTKPDEEVKRP